MGDVTFTSDSHLFLGSEENRIAASLFRPLQPKNEAKPPVLLMHGGGQTRHSWEKTAQKLTELGHVAVTADARGHGESEWVESANYSFPHYANDLIAITRQTMTLLGKEPVLVGASMGGLSGLLACADHGGRGLFSALVLVDVTPKIQESGVDRIMGFMAQNMREGFASPQDAADAIAVYLPNRKRPQSLDGLRKNLRLAADGRYYWHWDPAFIDGPCPISQSYHDSYEKLLAAVDAIAVPTLLVRGSRSELVSEEAAQEFLDLVPHAKFADISDAGHMVAGDRNDIFAEAVIDFLATELPASQEA